MASEWTEPAARARRIGQWCKRAPYGYALRDQALIPGDAVAIETVRWLFHEYANTTATLAGLARTLNARQVRTVEGGAWHDATVYRILSSPVYCGHKAMRRNVAGARPVVIARDTHEPLIDQALFDRVQERLTRSPRAAGKRERCPPLYPLEPEEREDRVQGKLERMMAGLETVKPKAGIPQQPRGKRRFGTGGSAAFRRRRTA